MNEALPPYPNYKPAGLPWLAQVPAHWEIVRLKNLFVEIDRRSGTGNEPLLSLSKSRGLIRQNELTDKIFSVADLSNYKVCQPNQIVMNRMQAWNGMFAIASETGLVSPDYAVLKSITEASVPFLLYLLKSPLLVARFVGESKGLGTGFNRLYTDRFGAIYAQLPPLPEQQRIVVFLEAKGQQIARLLRNKRQLIKLLTEQKQALIHQAVTQGLDAGAPRKDSGVAWLGEVPAHWTVVSIGRISKVGNGSTPSRGNLEYWSGGNYPWLNSSHANRDVIDSADQFVTAKALAECHLPKVPAGSVLVAITGQGKTRGKAALLGIEATINQHIAYITPNQRIKPEYLQLILTAAYGILRSISDDSGSTKGALTCSDLKRFKLAFPSIEEQDEVMHSLIEETRLLDQTISRAQREIELIQEYRTRLIADVVTGQVDIQNLDIGAKRDVLSLNFSDAEDEEEIDEELTELALESDE